jgi:hypothetical protein
MHSVTYVHSGAITHARSTYIPRQHEGGANGEAATAATVTNSQSCGTRPPESPLMNDIFPLEVIWEARIGNGHR